MFKRDKPRVVVLADQRNWAYDFDAQSLKRWLAPRYDITIRHARQEPDLARERFDLLYVLFYGDEHHTRFGIDPKKIIKQVSSHRWAYDDKRGRLTPEAMAEKFLSECRLVTTSSRRLLSTFAAIRPDVYYCPHGIELDAFEFRKRRGPLRIGWVGHPGDFLKGLKDILIPACEGRFDFTYTDGTWSFRRVRRFYREIDVLAISSIAEGDPRPLMEGMLCGCFPVSTDVGIVPEIVNHGWNGLIVDRSVEAFRDAFAWCERNLDRIRRVAAYNAMCCAAQRSAERVATRTGDVFDVALGIRTDVPADYGDGLRTSRSRAGSRRASVATMESSDPTADGYAGVAEKLGRDLTPLLPADRDLGVVVNGAPHDPVVRFLLENGYTHVEVAGADPIALLKQSPDTFAAVVFQAASNALSDDASRGDWVGPAYGALRDNGYIILLYNTLQESPSGIQERLARRLQGAGLRASAPPTARRHGWRLFRGDSRQGTAQRWQKRLSTRRVDVSIGIVVGSSPVAFRDPEGVRNPVLSASDVSDVPAGIVADPFMVRAGGVWYMFFEVFNEAARKGEIGLATSDDGLRWTYRRIVLAEPFHLSYPYVFEHGESYYMIPESGEAGEVRLYEATRFPEEWRCRGTLLSGNRCVDSSVVEHGGRWWLFAETSGGSHDTLRLYHATDLMGPWSEHPRSPLIERNPMIARPAGRVVVTDGRLFRYAQDCADRYGSRVLAFEITRLTPEDYDEKPAADGPVLSGSGHGWNSRGMHHVDAHSIGDNQWIACVDGFCEQPK